MRPAWAIIDATNSTWNNAAQAEVQNELTELARLIEYRPGMMAEELDQITNIEEFFRGILTYNRVSHPATSRLVGLAHEASTLSVMRYKTSISARGHPRCRRI